jgi:hypothetical protein
MYIWWSQLFTSFFLFLLIVISSFIYQYYDGIYLNNSDHSDENDCKNIEKIDLTNKYKTDSRKNSKQDFKLYLAQMDEDDENNHLEYDFEMRNDEYRMHIETSDDEDADEFEFNFGDFDI